MSHGTIDQEDKFLSQVHLPTSKEKQKEIGGDITLEEVPQAIKNGLWEVPWGGWATDRFFIKTCGPNCTKVGDSIQGCN